jgi:hypothetical protein
LRADELRIKLGLAVFEQHLDDFFQVRIELVEQYYPIFVTQLARLSQLATDFAGIAPTSYPKRLILLQRHTERFVGYPTHPSCDTMLYVAE